MQCGCGFPIYVSVLVRASPLTCQWESESVRGPDCACALHWAVCLPVQRWSGTLSACNAPVPVVQYQYQYQYLHDCCASDSGVSLCFLLIAFAFHIAQWRMRMRMDLACSVPVAEALASDTGTWALRLPWAEWLVPQHDGIALIRHSRGEGASPGGSSGAKQRSRLPGWSAVRIRPSGHTGLHLCRCRETKESAMSARRKEGATCEVSGRHPRSHWLVNEQSFIYHINSCPRGTRSSQEGS
jgi:hypothetical protein